MIAALLMALALADCEASQFERDLGFLMPARGHCQVMTDEPAHVRCDEPAGSGCHHGETEHWDYIVVMEPEGLPDEAILDFIDALAENGWRRGRTSFHTTFYLIDEPSEAGVCHKELALDGSSRDSVGIILHIYPCVPVQGPIAADSVDRAREFAELIGLDDVPRFTQIEEAACAFGSGAVCAAASSADISRAIFQDSLVRELGAAGWQISSPVEGWESGRPVIPSSLVRQWLDDSGGTCYQWMRIERAESTSYLHLRVATSPCGPIALPIIARPQSDRLEALLGISVDTLLRQDATECTPSNSCPDESYVMLLDADAFQNEVDPALQAARWEPLMITDTVEGGAIMRAYSRVHARSSEGQVVCADRLDYRHTASDPEALLILHLARCKE